MQIQPNDETRHLSDVTGSVKETFQGISVELPYLVNTSMRGKSTASAMREGGACDIRPDCGCHQPTVAPISTQGLRTSLSLHKGHRREEYHSLGTPDGSE